MTRASRLAAKFELQRKSWGKLRQILPLPIDLEMIEAIRGQEADTLRDPDRLELLIVELGLNDDGIEDFPRSLRPHCGRGLRIWQYPREFALYLSQLLRLDVRSYIELGIRHGGTFVMTVECLSRCNVATSALGVDIMPCPSMEAYERLNPSATFLCVSTQSEEFEHALDRHGPFDAALIDANHDAEECRHEFRLLRDRCSVIAFHDIVNPDFPDVGQVWADVRELDDFECHEYVSGYSEPHTPMGIGLAIRRAST